MLQTLIAEASADLKSRSTACRSRAPSTFAAMATTTTKTRVHAILQVVFIALREAHPALALRHPPWLGATTVAVRPPLPVFLSASPSRRWRSARVSAISAATLMKNHLAHSPKSTISFGTFSTSWAKSAAASVPLLLLTHRTTSSSGPSSSTLIPSHWIVLTALWTLPGLAR